MKYSKFKKQIKQNKGYIPETMDRIIQINGKEIVDPMNEQIDGHWFVNPIAVMDNRVFIICPFCGEVHTHGVGDGSYSGERTTDCKCGSNVYYLKPITI